MSEPPSLSETAQTRLQATVDGSDARGEGFAALVEDVELWEYFAGGLQAVDFTLISSNPEMFRGQMYEVSGELEQRMPLASPWEGTQEWFIRDSRGRVYILYVVGDSTVAAKSSISAAARFYKTMYIEGRDEQVRLYPTFVTSSHAIKLGTNDASFPLEIILFPLVAIAAITVFLLGKASSKKHATRRVAGVNLEDVLEAANDSVEVLPFDSASALAVMHSQSEEQE